MNIFVGNFPFEVAEKDIRSLFKGFGKVDSVAVVMEKGGRKSRGYGFVVMPNEEQALVAISVLNGRDFLGRDLNVSPADSKQTSFSDRSKKGGYKQGRRSKSYMRKHTPKRDRGAEGAIDPG